MRILSPRALEVVIFLAQTAYRRGVCIENPVVGSLVFEPTKLWARGEPVGRVAADVDAIGWLVASGLAPYVTDAQLRAQRLAGLPPSTDVRLVWDIIPLSGRRGVNGYMRWENALFVGMPADITELVSG